MRFLKADVFTVGSLLGFPHSSKADGEEERLQTEAATWGWGWEKVFLQNVGFTSNI